MDDGVMMSPSLQGSLQVAPLVLVSFRSAEGELTGRFVSYRTSEDGPRLEVMAYVATSGLRLALELGHVSSIVVHTDGDSLFSRDLWDGPQHREVRQVDPDILAFILSVV